MADPATPAAGTSVGTTLEQLGSAADATFQVMKEVLAKTADVAGAVAGTCQKSFAVSFDHLWNGALSEAGGDFLTALSSCAGAVTESVKTLIGG